MNRLLLVAIITMLPACSTSGPAPASTTPASTPAPAAAALPQSGRIVGTLQARGTAVVVLEPKGARTFPAQSEKPVMDQVGLTFGPELLFVRTGQPTEFRNNDDTLHNVNVKHEETREQAFNVAIPTGGSYEYTFTRDGFYRVACDIHPAMAASVFASTTPFTTMAASDGSFEFNEVEPGAWTVTVYADGKRVHKDVDVHGGLTEVRIE
jgi:plastocyanin